MQVSYGRLQAYAGMGFLSFAMIVLGSPIGNTGTWFGSMVMIGALDRAQRLLRRG